MESMPCSKDRSRGELEKLRELTFGEKLWYIWNYYNYYIIGGVVSVLIIVSLLRACVFTPNTGLFIAWESPYIETEQLDVLTEILNERLFEPEDNKVAEVSFFFTVADDPQVMQQHYDRLVAMLAAGMIDIFIVDDNSLKEFSYLEFILPLDEMLAEIRTVDPEMHKRLSDATVYELFGSDEHSITEQLVAVRVSDCPLFRELSIETYTDTYVCIAISCNNRYNAARALMEMFRED